MAQYLSPTRQFHYERHSSANQPPYYRRYRERVLPNCILALETLEDSISAMALYDFLGKVIHRGIDENSELNSDSNIETLVEAGMLVISQTLDLKGGHSISAETVITDGQGVPVRVREEYGVHPSGLLYRDLSNGLLLSGYLVPSSSEQQRQLVDTAITDLTRPDTI